VVGVDVGSGQLHASLRDHPQVVVLENVNARHLSAGDLNAALFIAGDAHSDSTNDAFSIEEAYEASQADLAPDAVEPAPQFDLIVGDLSFISQTLVLPAVVPFLKPGADLLMLVKPQFELQPGQVGKGGIVKDAALYAIVEQRIRTCCLDLGLQVIGWFDSPITGGDGNREFFIHAVRPAT
jgi:23S rRNA (cytidine1920-2'-O)/16S rRNA (cytidine1409-2'-O)-methyltransferase